MNPVYLSKMFKFGEFLVEIVNPVPTGTLEF
jgi:hypothetical protein